MRPAPASFLSLHEPGHPRRARARYPSWIADEHGEQGSGRRPAAPPRLPRRDRTRPRRPCADVTAPVPGGTTFTENHDEHDETNAANNERNRRLLPDDEGGRARDPACVERRRGAARAGGRTASQARAGTPGFRGAHAPDSPRPARPAGSGAGRDFHSGDREAGRPAGAECARSSRRGGFPFNRTADDVGGSPGGNRRQGGEGARDREPGLARRRLNEPSGGGRWRRGAACDIREDPPNRSSRRPRIAPP